MAAAGTLPRLHAQRPPMAQAKLVTVVEGAIFDVVVEGVVDLWTAPVRQLSRQAEAKYSRFRRVSATAS
jgi:hypothetical protein